MSNVQTLNTNNFFTPILLAVLPSADQKKLTEQFIEQRFKRKKNYILDYQLRWLNQEPKIIPIQTVRNLINELAYAGYLGQARIFVLRYADQLSLPAQHAFLKSLEEPPAGVQLLLVTAQPHNLLPTLLSRCILHHWQTDQDQEPAVTELPAIIEQLLFNKTKILYSQLIESAEKYKDRTAAISLVKQMLLQLYFRKKSVPTQQYSSSQKKLLSTLKKLQANTNVQLTLENCFFAIKP